MQVTARGAEDSNNRAREHDDMVGAGADFSVEANHCFECATGPRHVRLEIGS